MDVLDCFNKNKKKAEKEKLVVAAIDFGTTYSGAAFSFGDSFRKDPTKISAKLWYGGQLVAQKGPTCVLIQEDGKTFEAFGFEAETRYAELVTDGEHEKWYYFRRFKMSLYGEKKLSKDLMIEDATNKKLPALRVFSMCIRFLKDDLFKTMDGQTADDLPMSDVHWVLTVPAIWNDVAKEFMRKAAENAGIARDRLVIALEPEAAALFCRHLPVSKADEAATGGSLAQFKEGMKYIVLDAGGGTVDITVHEVSASGEIKEIHQASGGAWGGTKVDESFENFLKEIFGEATVEHQKKENIEAYTDLFMDFEIKKRKIHLSKTATKVTITIPVGMSEHHKECTGKDIKLSITNSKYANKIIIAQNKLRMNVELMENLFIPTAESIIQHIKTLLQLKELKDCTAIMMVGGFSESPILQDSVKNAFPTMTVLTPVDASLVVLKGAVIFGHKPTAITERVCKYTYGQRTSHHKSASCTHPPCRTVVGTDGITRCNDLFQIHVKKGQKVKLGEKQKGVRRGPAYDHMKFMTREIYATTEENPVFVTDKGCIKIGEVKVPVTGGTKGSVETVFVFGGTEIEVLNTDILTGNVTKHRVDFPG